MIRDLSPPTSIRSNDNAGHQLIYGTVVSSGKQGPSAAAPRRVLAGQHVLQGTSSLLGLLCGSVHANHVRAEQMGWWNTFTVGTEWAGRPHQVSRAVGCNASTSLCSLASGCDLAWATQVCRPH